MIVVEALRLPLSVDLSGFVALLRRLQVPCRVSEEAGEQVLRVPEQAAEQVRLMTGSVAPVAAMSAAFEAARA